MIELNEHQLLNLLTKAAEAGARRALIGAGMESPTMSWNQAVKVFGQAAMLNWKKAGLIQPIQQGMGAVHKYSVSQLVELALTENRAQYLTYRQRREASPDRPLNRRAS